MALDALAVPAMSDECERLFSSAKILLSDRRCRLKMDIIEASECLRAWYGPAPPKSFDDKAVDRLEEGSEEQGGDGAEDTDTDGGDPDEGGSDTASGEEIIQDTGEGVSGEDNELYCT